MAVDIRKPLKKFLPHLLKAKEDGVNEADTVQRVMLCFQDVLGYDLLHEVTRESQVKDKFVDLAVKLDGKIRLLVEVKSADTVLRDRHIEQAERYAAEGNHQWVLLTSGVVWNLYHLTFDEGIEYERVFSCDLTGGDLDGPSECLAILHRSSISRGDHENYWQRHQARTPESIGKALFSFDVLRLMRRQIRRREGILIDVEDLAAAIREMFSAEARERIGIVKIQRRRVGKRPAKAQVAESPTPTA
jgi:predicted type IV restriction endonuclease